MKGLKHGLKVATVFGICTLVTFRLAVNFKSNEVIILFLGGCLSEKISNVFEK
jgi:hypothetical protein